MSIDSCGAPPQGATPASWNANNQFVIAGEVTGANEPVQGAFVQLLDSEGNFTGEVVSSLSGEFRFYVASGEWQVRAIHREGTAEATVTTIKPRVHKIALKLGKG